MTTEMPRQPGDTGYPEQSQRDRQKEQPAKSQRDKVREDQDDLEPEPPEPNQDLPDEGA